VSATAILFTHIVVEVKAVAWELPQGTPAVQRDITASVSRSTVWRCLKADAIKPWLYRSFIVPRELPLGLDAG